ncbi:hypothetical protein [Leptospira interrogans]|uniref:hypothetical protein n=1 Tax=Leptospira interrogans TaxID=173 RepID=UPI00356B7234
MTKYIFYDWFHGKPKGRKNVCYDHESIDSLFIFEKFYILTFEQTCPSIIEKSEAISKKS